MARARCLGCGRTFRLPEGRRAARCPKCGGRVEVTAPAEGMAAPDGTVACPSCGEENWPDDLECGRCGTELAGPRLAARRGDRTPFGRHQWKRANRFLIYVRLVYVAAAIYLGLSAIQFGLLLTREGGEAFAPFLVVAAGLGALSFVGIFRVPREPFFWTVLLAVMLTAYTLLALLLFLQESILARHLIRAIVASVFVWSAVPVAANVRRFVREDPDFFVPEKKRKRARRRVDRGEVVTRARARGRTATASSLKTAALVGVPILLVVVAGIWAVVRDRTAPPIDDARAAFETAWNASDYDAIGEMWRPSGRAKLIRYLKRRPTKRGWGEPLPRLGGSRSQTNKTQPPKVAIWYALPDLAPGREVMIRWAYGDGQWWLDKVKPIGP